MWSGKPAPEREWMGERMSGKEDGGGGAGGKGGERGERGERGRGIGRERKRDRERERVVQSRDSVAGATPRAYRLLLKPLLIYII